MSHYRNDTARLAGAFKALAHPVRLALFRAIRRNCCLGAAASGEVGGCHVGNIYQAVEVAPSTVSHHLKELKHAGLIVERRCGKFLYLTLGHDAVAELVRFALGEATDPDHTSLPPPAKARPRRRP